MQIHLSSTAQAVYENSNRAKKSFEAVDLRILGLCYKLVESLGFCYTIRDDLLYSISRHKLGRIKARIHQHSV